MQNLVCHWRDLVNIYGHIFSIPSIAVAFYCYGDGQYKHRTRPFENEWFWTGGKWCGIRNGLVNPGDMLPFNSLQPEKCGNNHKWRTSKFVININIYKQHRNFRSYNYWHISVFQLVQYQPRPRTTHASPYVTLHECTRIMILPLLLIILPLRFRG